MWNKLPKNLVEVKTIEDFKKALDKHWKDDPLKFDHLHERGRNEVEE